MTDELKPCPLCGSEAMLLYGLYNECCVSCRNNDCEFCGDAGNDEQAVIDRWNNRPLEDAIQAEVERLKGIIREVEWVNLTDGDGNFAYQECSECGYSREHGHHQDCPFRGWEAPDETQA